MMKGEINEHKKAEEVLLQELYRELRFYRVKEFISYIFSILIILYGMLWNVSFLENVAIAITSLLIVYWLYRNLYRSLRIKRSIFLLQESLGLNREILLHTKEWKDERNIFQHLGTAIYIMNILILLIIFLIHGI